jgi:23S rRNA pseudouridine1911/1915/1917 synthase
MSIKEHIQILYEDEAIVAILKPAGILVHGDGKANGSFISDWVLAQYPHIEQIGEDLILNNGTHIKRPGIVHRIDGETSGVLLIAKTEESFFDLKKQFQERTIKKIYRAFLYGIPRKREGVIDKPIGRSAGDFRLFSAEYGSRGVLRDAKTEYAVLGSNIKFSYVEARPHTGRTHQIRVHFKALGYPIICDKRYAPNRSCALGFNRLALHALSITFRLLSGTGVTVEAPFPVDFEEALRTIYKPQ